MNPTQALENYQRIALGPFPTPLQELPRLSIALRRPVYIKRDDLPGPALGGNKARKLEYLMADAQAHGLRRVVTFGGLQSNHARLTAAAARMLGLEPHLFLFGKRPATLTGNLLVNQMLGAHMYFVPLPEGDEPNLTLERSIQLVRLLARLVVGKQYYIPVGGHSWLGSLGYVRAALELDAQACELGLEQAHVILAAGTGGTLAGLMAGLKLAGSQLQPLGIDVGRLWKDFPHSISQLATELCIRLGAPYRFRPGDVPLIEHQYVGARYGVPSATGLAAAQRLALLEGIILDPIYTAKAFAALLGLAERGLLGRSTPLIFLHTGGTPGVFAF